MSGREICQLTWREIEAARDDPRGYARWCRKRAAADRRYLLRLCEILLSRERESEC